jgi:hypothetical protein
MNRITVCLIMMSLLFWSCTSEIEHPDEVPTRAAWYVEPGVQERLDEAQDRFAADWAEWLFHFQRDECAAPPAQIEEEGLDEEDPFDDILDDNDNDNEDDRGEEYRESDEEPEDNEEVRGASLRLAGGFAATASKGPDHWLCQPGVLTWECADLATETVVYETMRRRFHELPPTMQPEMLDAYVDDFLWALEIIAESEHLYDGIADVIEICEDQGSPLSIAVEQSLIPDLKDRWGWERGERFPDELPGYLLTDLISSPCELTATYHRQYLGEYQKLVSRWRTGAPTCFSYRPAPPR